jgi:hypothetical protein
MTTKHLIDRGLQIVHQIDTLKTELDQIETQLEKLALAGDHQELKDPDREGRRFLAAGTDKIVPIIFTADKIVASFKENSAVHQTIRVAAIDGLSNSHLPDFFKRTVYWENLHKDGKAFRAAALEILGKDKGPTFVTCCLAKDKHGIPKSDTKIDWAKAETIKQTA